LTLFNKYWNVKVFIYSLFLQQDVAEDLGPAIRSKLEKSTRSWEEVARFT
jgi:hypothetical protein